MSNIKIIKGNGRELSIDRDSVFKQIKCDEDNPMYEEFNEEYEELLPEVLAALDKTGYRGSLYDNHCRKEDLRYCQ